MKSSIPNVFLLLKYLSWFGYANEALLINQWHGNVTIECDKMRQLCFTSGDQVLDYFSAQPVSYRYFIHKQITHGRRAIYLALLKTKIGNFFEKGIYLVLKSVLLIVVITNNTEDFLVSFVSKEYF